MKKLPCGCSLKVAAKAVRTPPLSRKSVIKAFEKSLKVHDVGHRASIALGTVGVDCFGGPGYRRRAALVRRALLVEIEKIVAAVEKGGQRA